MNSSWRCVKLCVLTIITLFQTAGLRAGETVAASPVRMTPLVAAGQPRCAIVAPLEDELAKRTAARLAAYLHEQTGAKPPVLSGTGAAGDSQPAIIVIDGSSNHSLLAKFGITIDVPGDRADAYHLRVVRQDKHTVIAVAGRSTTGAKYGVYRLMEEMELSQGSAAVSDLDLAISPFFKTRSVSLFNVWRVPVEVVRRCNLESWPAERIQRAIDAYDVLGFNAVETHDRFHEDFLKAVYGITREQWREKVYALCDRAHEDGMTVFLRLWGNSVALPVSGLKDGYTPFGFVNLAPDIPAERNRWETEIRDYASRSYAAHVDHLIGHWADAGGIHPGSHATIKDAMLLHNELRAAFRAINPKIETSFNLWNMARPQGRRGWPGYVDHRTITTAGVLAKDMIIAQATRARSLPYSEKVTREILADGYRAAVWTWRRGDTEVRLSDPGLRIRIHGIMSDYFHGLPASASQLEWHNIERNQHGLANDVNYYIASKLMWDPKADEDAALNKYCALVFGKANAAPVAEAFLTIEDSRDPEMGISKSILSNPAAGASRARRALEALASVKLPEGHHSRLPSVTSPQEMLDELRGTLAIIAENADLYARQLPAIDALLKAGKKAEAKAQAAETLKKADAWFGTIAGGVEGLWLKETLEARLETGVPQKAKEWFGFRTYNVTSLEEKDSWVVLHGDGKAPSSALLQLEKPARSRVEFHFQCKVAEANANQNGGLAFGPTLSPPELVRCEAYVGGHVLHIRGQNIVSPVRTAAPDLDPSKPLDCTVVVDLDRHRVTFKAGQYSAEAALKESVREIRWYGYVVEKTKTQFGAIEVKQAE